MSKGNSNGLMRGKLGNKVMYAITNSNNKETQGERAYVAKVANPKTVSQAVQRMKMAPAVNFYRAFKQEVLNHSWQGIKYGGRSHSFFMREVLKSKDAVYPFVPKGTTELIPGQFPVSRGGLPGVPVLSISSSEFYSNYGVLTDLAFDDLAGVPFEKVVTTWVSYNDGILSKGDQITFVAVLQKNGSFFPYVKRLVLDSSKYPAVSVYDNDFINTVGFSLIDSKITLPLRLLDDGYEIAAAAVVISRPQVSKTTGDVTWLRSNADMFVDPDIIAKYNSQEAYDAAITTYLKSGVAVSSDWYLNDGTYNAAGSKIPVAPGINSGIQLELNQVRNSLYFGKWQAVSVNAPARTRKVVADITMSNELRTVQLYSLLPRGINPGDDTPSSEGLTILYPMSKTPDRYEAPFDEDAWANLIEGLGETETAAQAVAEQAALGNTYTIGEYQA